MDDEFERVLSASSIGAARSLAAQTPPHIIERLTREGGRMPHKGATRAVVRNLTKDAGDRREAWESMSLESVEEFTDHAKAWLRDRSELRTSTIENADYAELLQYFRGLADWKPRHVKIPGLDATVPVRDEPPARKGPVKVQMTREGIPTGRYAVEVPGWGLRFFWVKLEGDKLMQHTAIRFLDDNDKWRMYYGGVREVVELIKQAGWAAASRYGEAKNTCAICGRPLTVSAIKGIGPECADQVGENPFGPNN